MSCTCILEALAWTIHETPNPSTDPFFCSGFCEGAEYWAVFPTEQDSLQPHWQRKGARKDLVISARLALIATEAMVFSLQSSIYQSPGSFHWQLSGRYLDICRARLRKA